MAVRGGRAGPVLQARRGLIHERADDDAAAFASHLGANIVVGAEVGAGAGLVYTGFRIRAEGFARFLVCDRSFTPRQAGRLLQRLFEMEAYGMMALLALPIARRQAPLMREIERALARLTEKMADERVTTKCC